MLYINLVHGVKRLLQGTSWVAMTLNCCHCSMDISKCEHDGFSQSRSHVYIMNLSKRRKSLIMQKLCIDHKAVVCTYLALNQHVHSLECVVHLSPVVHVCLYTLYNNIYMLNKNTWGVKKCGANQKQHYKQAKRFDIS